MEFNFNCREYIDFDNIPSPDDTYFQRKGSKTNQNDKFLKTIDMTTGDSRLDKAEDDNGSYSEDGDKAVKRKSHPMRTRQDAVEMPAEYESMAEKVVKFFHKTPTRFKPTKHTEINRGVVGPIPNTQPVTPHFQTDRRIRRVYTKSKEELEEEEVQAMKSLQFRANPVKNRVLGRSASCRENSRVRSKAEVARSVVERLAKPKDRPPSNAEHPKSTVQKRRFISTHAQSPALQTKKRAMMNPELSESNTKQVTQEKFYHPPPKFDHAFQPKLKHQVTKPEPFSFHSKDMQRIGQKEARIQEKLAEERELANKFKAHPLPPDSPTGVPEKKVRTPTRPQSFNFKSDARGASYREKFNRDREISDEMKRQQSSFKARPAEVLKKAPFEPAKPSRFIESDCAPTLSTESRAEHRRVFEDQMSLRERQVLEEMNQARKEQEMKELDEARNKRNQAVHKAHPVRQFKRVEIHPSEKIPTVPKSPNFSKRFNK